MKKHERIRTIVLALGICAALLAGMIPGLSEGTITSDPITVPDADPSSVTIVGFEEASPIELPLTYKPEQEAAALLFPQTLTANLSDNTTLTVDVTWSCADYDTGLDGEYEFTCELAEGAPELGEGVTLPTGKLTVAPAKSGAYTYRLNEQDELTIIGWDGTDTDLIVPAQIDNYPVVGIGDAAFSGKSLLTMELPNTLKRIGDNAFASCAQLTRLVIPDSLESAGVDIIKDDAALTELVLRTELDTTITRAEDDTAYILNRVVEVAGDGTSETGTEGEKTTVPVTATLPFDPTDIRVLTGTLTLDADFTVAAGHSITVEAEGTLNLLANRTLTNLGTISNQGALNYSGTIINCAGTYTGNEAVSVNGFFVTDHNWVDGYCSVCGAEQPEDNKTIVITYKGPDITKVYDATRNFVDPTYLKGSNFPIDNEQLTLGTNVRIKGFRAVFDGPDAGNHTITIRFTLTGDDAEHYTPQELELTGTITPKLITVTPAEGQTKVYGTKDPSFFNGKVKGTLKEKNPDGTDKKLILNSRFSREQGEDVGQYKYILGDFKVDSNYIVEIAEGYFTITPKDISESGVSMASVSNQRYTGAAITPGVTLRYAGNILQEGTDYKLSYSDNVDAGTATVKVTGIGNFNGERSATFRILNVVTDFDDSDGPGGSDGSGSKGKDDDDDWSGVDTIDDDDDWSGVDTIDDDESGPGGDGEGDSTDTPDGVKKYHKNRLRVGGEEFDPMLYRGNGEILDYAYETDADEEQLTILALPDTEHSLITEDGYSELLEYQDRDNYGEQYLRLTPETIEKLKGNGFTEIVYELEYARLVLPLDGFSEQVEVVNEDELMGPAGPQDNLPERLEVPEEVDMDLEADKRDVEKWEFCIRQSEEITSPFEDRVVNGEDAFISAPYTLKMIVDVKNPEPGLTIRATYPENARLDIQPLYQQYGDMDSVRMLCENEKRGPEDAVVEYEPTRNVEYGVEYFSFDSVSDGTYAIVQDKEKLAEVGELPVAIPRGEHEVSVVEDGDCYHKSSCQHIEDRDDVETMPLIEALKGEKIKRRCKDCEGY